MVRCLRGCNNVATTMVLFFFVFIFNKTPGVFARSYSLVELSKRENMLQMAGYGEEKLSTVLISGTVLCRLSYSKEAELVTEYVSGATVGVLCHPRRKQRKLSKWIKATTDAYGDFAIDLPSNLHAIPNLEKNCVVKVVRLPKSSICRPFSIGKLAEGLKLASEKYGIRTYVTQKIYLLQKPSQGHEIKVNL